MDRKLAKAFLPPTSALGMPTKALSPATATFSGMPTELKQRVFALLTHPASLASVSKHWLAISTAIHTYALWLNENSRWLDDSFSKHTWAPRRWTYSPKQQGRHIERWASSDLSEPVPRIVATNPKFVEMFVKHRGNELRWATGSHLFLWACEGGHADIVTLILRLDFSSGDFVIGSNMQSTVSSAALHPRIPTAELEAALFRATDAGHVNVLRALVAQRPDGRVRLHLAGDMAARRGHTNVLQFLLQEEGWKPGRDPRSQALQMAVENGHARAVELLLQYGYDESGHNRARRKRTNGAAVSGAGAREFGAGLDAWTDKVFGTCVGRGDLDVLRVLVDGGVVGDVDKAVIEARRLGFNEVLVYLNERFTSSL